MRFTTTGITILKQMLGSSSVIIVNNYQQSLGMVKHPMVCNLGYAPSDISGYVGHTFLSGYPPLLCTGFSPSTCPSTGRFFRGYTYFPLGLVSFGPTCHYQAIAAFWVLMHHAMHCYFPSKSDSDEVAALSPRLSCSFLVP